MVEGRVHNSLKADLASDDHKLVSGLKADLGGKDEGPDPHRLLESSLAACTLLTMQLYANRKQWTVQEMAVTVRITKEDKDGTIIERGIKFPAELPADQKERLLEIAGKCPIHKLLSGSVTINTRAE